MKKMYYFKGTVHTTYILSFSTKHICIGLDLLLQLSLLYTLLWKNGDKTATIKIKKNALYKNPLNPI